MDPKKFIFLFSCKYFSIFGHQNPGSGSALKSMRVHNTGYKKHSSSPSVPTRYLILGIFLIIWNYSFKYALDCLGAEVVGKGMVKGAVKAGGLDEKITLFSSANRLSCLNSPIIQYLSISLIPPLSHQLFLKETVSHDGNVFWSSKHFNQYFLWMRCWFSRSFKSFRYTLQFITLYCFFEITYWFWENAYWNPHQNSLLCDVLLCRPLIGCRENVREFTCHRRLFKIS